jgi:hypothetical protein
MWSILLLQKRTTVTNFNLFESKTKSPQERTVGQTVRSKSGLSLRLSPDNHVYLAQKNDESERCLTCEEGGSDLKSAVKGLSELSPGALRLAHRVRF